MGLLTFLVSHLINFVLHISYVADTRDMIPPMTDDRSTNLAYRNPAAMQTQPTWVPATQPPAHIAAEHVGAGARSWRNRLRYVIASVRYRWKLAMVVFLLSVAVGLFSWILRPMAWVTHCSIMTAVPAMDSTPMNRTAPHTDAVSVASLLVDANLVRNAAASLQLETAETQSLRNKTAVSELLEWFYNQFTPTRVTGTLKCFVGLPMSLDEVAAASSIGMTDSDAPFRATILPSVADSEIVQLQITSADPAIAENAPQALLDAARNQLVELEHTWAKSQLEEVQPLLAAAQVRLAEAETAQTDYRLDIGRQDPSAYASQVEERLASAHADQAELETEIEEVEAERFSIITQLRQLEEDHEQKSGTIVRSNNPRLRELRREISELETQLAGLIEFTERHPQKVAIKNQLRGKQRELESERQIVVLEEVTQNNPLYQELRNTQLMFDRRLTQLAGREVGLAITEDKLIEDLAIANTASKIMVALILDVDIAISQHTQLLQTVDRLSAIYASQTRFDHLRFVQSAKVADLTRPDLPHRGLHLVLTIAIAVFLSISIPTLVCSMGSRLYTNWQIEHIASDTQMIEILGELPDGNQRKLLRSSRYR